MAKNSPKVSFNGKQYFVVEEAGQSVRLTNGTESFIVLKSKTKPITLIQDYTLAGHTS